MDTYEAIFRRRAVRTYDPEPLPSETLASITQLLANTDRLAGQTGRFELVGTEGFSGNTATHAILAFCEDDDAAYANVGYVLQNLDLYLQSRDLGGIWNGMGKVAEKSEDFCILYAFGKPTVPLRTGEADFKRLALAEISAVDNTVARAVRLAPSAINSQPWKLSFEPDKVVLHYVGRGLTKLMLRKKMNKIDLGIAARHVAVALQHEGTPITATSTQTNGKDFTITLEY